MLAHTPLKRTCLPIPPRPHMWIEEQQDLLYILNMALSIYKDQKVYLVSSTSFEKVNSTLKIRDVEISFAKSTSFFIMDTMVNGDRKSAKQGDIIIIINN